MSRQKARLFAVVLAVVGAIAAPTIAARHAQALPTSATPLASPPPIEAIAKDKDALDRETPRRTMTGFLNEGREGDFGVAANYLDLGDVPQSQRDHEGPILAQKLAYVLAHLSRLDLDKIPDVPEGDPTAKPPGTFVADTLYVGEQPIRIVLTRVRFSDGVGRWLIARTTVAAIPTLDAAYGPRPVPFPIPSALTRWTLFGNEPWQWIGIALAVVGAYAIARATAAVLVRAATYFAQRTPTQADDALVESARRPLRTIITALALRALLGPLQLTTDVIGIAEHVTYTLLVVGIAWLVLRMLGVATLWLDEQVEREAQSVAYGRRVRTRAVLLRRVASVVIAFLTSALVLLQFEFVRSVGVSLLASAGVASVVVGLAAQKSLSAIIGGIQFSFAQPVRMGDQVVVEGEFGELEEINLTYAVVRLWDKRRMILPITYFLEKPFQNWTRSATDVVGVVLFKADFGIPVDELRKELHRICESDALWDKKVCKLQVTESDAASVTLRALVSATNASDLWDLRCNVRERLLTFIRSHEDGKYLARSRHSVQSSSGGPPNSDHPGSATPSTAGSRLG
jgi:small-conductance mechanosensitive channel